MLELEYRAMAIQIEKSALEFFNQKTPISQVLTPDTIWTKPVVIQPIDADAISAGAVDLLPILSEVLVISNRPGWKRQLLLKERKGKWGVSFSAALEDPKYLTEQVADQIADSGLVPHKTGLFTAVIDPHGEQVRVIHYASRNGDLRQFQEQHDLKAIEADQLPLLKIDPPGLRSALLYWRSHPACIG